MVDVVSLVVGLFGGVIIWREGDLDWIWRANQWAFGWSG